MFEHSQEVSEIVHVPMLMSVIARFLAFTVVHSHMVTIRNLLTVDFFWSGNSDLFQYISRPIMFLQ